MEPMQSVCEKCWKVVLGPSKELDTEYFQINSKHWCSLGCYYENEEDIKIQNQNNANKGNKRSKKIYKKRSKQKTRKTK